MTGPLFDPFILGFVAGGFLFGILGIVIGCLLGYDAGAHHVTLLRIEADEVHGDMPNYRLSDGTDVSRMTADEIAAHLQRLGDR